MSNQPAAEAVVVEPGQPAPSFALKDQAGRTHQLADYRGRWVVLYFYPKDDTPGCTKEACQFRDDRALFQQASAVVLGVSPDDQASHQKFAAKYALPFDLLADPRAQTCQQYGVWREKVRLGKGSMGVVRTTYLIDPAGRVARRWDGVSVEGHQKEVLTAIQSLSQGR